MPLKTAVAIAGGVTLVAVIGACSDSKEPSSAATSQSHPEPVIDTAAFETRAHEIIAGYTQWTRMPPSSQEILWAPELCRPPQPEFLAPAEPLPSIGEHAPHGQKLYYLFAHLADAYGISASTQLPPIQPVGQAFVKESWIPLVQDQNDSVPLAMPRAVIRNQRDGKFYYPGPRSYLFMMFKLDPQTPGTDQGWVYATATPDGQRITAIGRIDSCMSCHAKSPTDRVFGLEID